MLYLITARAGSKGIPGKNALSVGGIPLIAYKAISAKKSEHCHRLIISTDGKELQGIAQKYGAEVLFDRPAKLATDSASSEDVIVHTMQYISDHDPTSYDAIMLLEPTSPFATHEDYDQAIALMEERDANLVVGMRRIAVNSMFQGTMDEAGNIHNIINNIVRGANNSESLNRQQFPREYTMNGAFYLIRWDFFKKTKQRYCDPENSYGIVMPPERSVELDEPLDLKFAQFICDEQIIDLSYWKE